MSRLPDEELHHWLLLLHLHGLGIAHIKALVDVLGSPRALFGESRVALAHCGLSSEIIEQIKNPPWSAIRRDVDWLAASSQHHIIPYTHENYPALLLQAAAFPPVLFVRGNLSVLNEPQLAIVGSRNPTPHGIENARQFAYELANKQWVITSGLAIGIDGAAHEGALMAKGKTIAVAATGLDSIYPARHRVLAEKIIEQGAIVSEFVIGTKPHARHFPRRNRIISGLSKGVIVIEAAVKSGSLITAKYAAEQSREVFALPGSIRNPLSKGCHALIRQGAVLVETVDDILQEAPPKTVEKRVRQQTVESDQQKVIYYLG